MDPSLLRESKNFKKRAMEVPSVENKKKKEKAPAEEPKVKKRSSFASPKLDASNYKSFGGSTPHKFAVLAKIVKHMQKRHLDGEDHPLSLDEILDETTQLDVSSSTKTWLANTALPQNPKIETTDENTYMYKPVYKIRDKKSFLKLLRAYDLKGLGGVSLKDISESLPNSEKILKVFFLSVTLVANSFTISLATYMRLPNKPNLIANVNSGIDEELSREIKKDNDSKGFYFKMPSFYLIWRKDERCEIWSQFVKIYRRRFKTIKDNFDVIQPQQGTGIYMNANDMLEKLYSLLGSRSAGNTCDEVGNEAIDLLDSLFKNKIINDYNTIYNNYLRIR